MDAKEMYRDVIKDHNLYPDHKEEIKDPDIILRGVNPSCGDDITLQLKVKDGIIEDGSFTGSGCAVSQASADVMLEMIIGKSVDEALRLDDIFERMIRGEASEDEIDELDDAGAFEAISHMPARVKCALLGWRTVKEMLEPEEEKNS